MLATRAYERREEAEYWRAGVVASAIYNVHRTKGKRAKPGDFVPKRKRKAQSPERMALILKAATLAMGGEVLTA